MNNRIRKASDRFLCNRRTTEMNLCYPEAEADVAKVVYARFLSMLLFNISERFHVSTACTRAVFLYAQPFRATVETVCIKNGCLSHALYRRFPQTGLPSGELFPSAVLAPRHANQHISNIWRSAVPVCEEQDVGYGYIENNILQVAYCPILLRATHSHFTQRSSLAS